MRILQLVNIGFEAGGAEHSVRLIAEGLTRRGHQVRVVATDLLSGGQDDVFADHLVPAIRGSAPRRLLRYFWYQRAYREVRTVLEDFKPDCVHLHTIGEFSPSVLAATARHRRVLTVHGPEDWTLDLLRWNLAGATRAGRLSPGDHVRYAYLRFLQRPAYRAHLRHIDRVLVPSHHYASVIAADVDAARVHVLPNGIERTVYPQEMTHLDHVLFVGRLERVKGVDVLLAAFRAVAVTNPLARLTVVGDGSHRQSLQSHHADLLRSGRVTFTGWLPAAQVSARIAESSVVVLPSIWPENFPTVALEALQAGRPIVASRVGGLPELVGDDNGLLVPPDDHVALAKALNCLLGSRDRLARLGAGSAARADRYDAGSFVTALEHHYEEICA